MVFNPLHGIKIEGFLVNVRTKPKKNVTSLKLYSFGRYGPLFSWRCVGFWLLFSEALDYTCSAPRRVDVRDSTAPLLDVEKICHQTAKIDQKSDFRSLHFFVQENHSKSLLL